MTANNTESRRLPRWNHRRLLVWILPLIVLVIGGIIWHRQRRQVPIEPPFVPLDGLETPVAQAIDNARKRVRQSPRSGTLWGRLGMILGGHGFRPQAIICFTEAEHWQPMEALWPYLLGVGLQLEGREVEALPPLRRAVRLCGNEPDAPRLRLAELLLKQSQWDEAETHFRALLADKADLAPAQLGMARLALARGNAEAARRWLQDCLDSPAVGKAAQQFLAEVEQHLGNADAAREALRQAAARPADKGWLDPFQHEIDLLRQDCRSRVNRVLRLRQHDKIDEMRQVLDGLENDHPGTYPLLKGRQFLDAKDYAAAEQWLREAVRRAPDFPQTHFWLGVALFHRDNVKEATTCFRAVVKLQLRHADAYSWLARCLEQQQQRSDAIDALRTAINYAPQNAEFHRRLGALLVREGRNEEAMTHLRQALSLQPDDAQTRQLLEQNNLK